MRNFRYKYKIKLEKEKVATDLKLIKEKRILTQDQFKKVLAFHLGSALHEDWKEEDRVAYENASEEEKLTNWEQDPDGELRKFVSVDGKIKNINYRESTFRFEKDNHAYRRSERKIDVRALDFKELPFVLKKKYVETGSWLMDLLYEEVMINGEKDIDKLLSNSESYQKLPEELKEKYKRYAGLALNLLYNVKEGKISLSQILEDEGLSIAEFNVGMKKVFKTNNRGAR